MSAFGQAQQGAAANAAAKFNAKTYEANAQFSEEDKAIVSENARIDRRRLAEQYHAVVGDFINNTAAGGIDPNFGSAKNVQDDAKHAYDIDRRIDARNEVAGLTDKDREAYNYRRQAAVTRAAGKNAANAGNLAAFATLLQGASTASQQLPGG